MKKTYIKFELIRKLPKTEVYHVTNISSDHFLGTIKWYGPWRQYCFFPDKETVYSRGCMKDIIDFIDTLMKKR